MVWAIASLVALLIIPGAIIAGAGGTRLPWALALGPAVTFSVAGLAGLVLGALNIRFTLVSVAVCWAVVLVLALCWRGGWAFFSRCGASARASRGGSAGASNSRSTWRNIGYGAIAGLGVTVAAVVLGWTAISRIATMPQGMETIQQSWDTLWHASVLRSITEDEMASPTRMGEIQNVETHAQSYYPAAWHAFGALWALVVGLSIPAVVNYLGVVIPAVLIPTAAAALAWRIADRKSLSSAVAAGIAALFAAALPVLMPIGVFVSAWPYQVAMALAITVFAFVTSLPHCPQRIFIAVLALVGIGQLHPSSVPTVVLLGGVWWLFYRLPRPARPELGAVRARLYDVFVIAAAFVPALAVLLPQWLSGKAQTADVREVTAEVEGLDRFGSWYRAFTMLTRHSEEYRPFWPVILIGLLGMALVTFAGWPRPRRRRQVAADGEGQEDRRLARRERWLVRRAWVVPAWLLSVVMTTHALKHFGTVAGSVLAVYTDLHYSTPHRLVMTTAYIVSASAGIAVAWICAWVGRSFENRVPATGKVVGLSLATVSSAVLVVYGVSANADPADYSYKTPREWALISQADLKAFDWLAEQPEAHEYRTFSNPAQGSGWMYARNDLPVVFPHYDWPVADKYSATSMVYWHADYLGAGEKNRPNEINKVDKAAAKLNIGFIYLSPPNYWDYQKTPKTLSEKLWNSKGVAPVYRDREVVIFALKSVIPQERIDEMRASSPEALPPLPAR